MHKKEDELRKLKKALSPRSYLKKYKQKFLTGQVKH